MLFVSALLGLEAPPGAHACPLLEALGCGNAGARALFLRGNVAQLTELAGSATRARGRRLHRLGPPALTQEATRLRGRVRERGVVGLPTPCIRNGQALTTVATLCLVQEEAATQGGRQRGVRRCRLHSLSLRTGVLSPLPPCLPKPLLHHKHKSRQRQQEGHKGRHTH
jgi:hypothetical protein